MNRVVSDNDYLDHGFWTPQTMMLRRVREWIASCREENIARALSVDVNPTLTELVEDRWESVSITVAALPEHDAQDLSAFEDGWFDLTYSHQVLEHIRKPWLAAEEFIRVTRSGGIGIHTTCASNPMHGPPAFRDYYRFLPDGLEAIFDGVEVLSLASWGNRQALAYNLTIDDGHGDLGGRRFHRALGEPNEESFPWHTWIIYRKP